MDWDLIRIRRALISVSDKTDLEILARALIEKDVEILCSGGTARYLESHNIPFQKIENFTGAPEMLDGRVKTLHPKIHGGILARRDNDQHVKALEKQNYVPIDLVVVNLYPFEETAKKENISFHEVIEQIDIGGPTLLRAAAKNFSFVGVLASSNQYKAFLKEFQEKNGCTCLEFRKKLAHKVFERTQVYDNTIANFFQNLDPSLPSQTPLALEQKWTLRYGENPHQKGGFYLPAEAKGKTLLEKVLQGKALSYNNLMDVHAALSLICEFEKKFTVAILKHTNPCGAGISEHSLKQAYERALECDSTSAFGGIVVFSSPVDEETAQVCTKIFTEIIIAPGFSEKSLKIFSKKKNLRLLEVSLDDPRSLFLKKEIRPAADGFLIQDRDNSLEDLSKAEAVTRRSPTPEEMQSLELAWNVAKHVKSNAIVLANSFQTIGIGAGQMSRVDSSRIAIMKANPEKLLGAALASDAFFPFRDGVDEAAQKGVRCIVQPGGSVRDQEVIQAADEHGMAMLFTGVRHFRH